MLSEIEEALHSAAWQSPFPPYVVDLAPAQIRVIEDHILRLRSQLVRALDWQHITPDLPEIPLTRSVLTDLAFVDIAIEELRCNQVAWQEATRNKRSPRPGPEQAAR
jgi:hypothetical protein